MNSLLTFVAHLNRELGELQAVEVLCHEWPHPLARNFTLDQPPGCVDSIP